MKKSFLLIIATLSYISFTFVNVLADHHRITSSQQTGKCLSILDVKERLRTTNDKQTADAIRSYGVCFQVDDKVLSDIGPSGETKEILERLKSTIRIVGDLKFEVKNCSLEGGSSVICKIAVTNLGTDNDHMWCKIHRSSTFISDRESKISQFEGILRSNIADDTFLVSSDTTYVLTVKFNGFDRRSTEASQIRINLYNIYKVSGNQQNLIGETYINWKNIVIEKP